MVNDDNGNNDLGIPQTIIPKNKKKSLKGQMILSFFVVSLLIPVWFWYGCRVEPSAGQFAVLIKKTGKDLPSGKILASDYSEKGIQKEILPEGRYFYNPYVWSWKYFNITDIPAGKLGVKIRLYGDELPHGQIIAGEGQKGIVREILEPGRYRINPYAYEVRIFDAISISSGNVGVVTKLTGKDILSGENPEKVNSFLAGVDDKGVQSAMLEPGTYYLNPYIYMVTIVNLKSQRFEMSSEDAINFLSLDGFTITVEGTIEWAINKESAPLITMEVGDMDDILNKIILPRARGFSRIEGSKKSAIEYIMGETRQEFQNKLFQHMSDNCIKRGVEIRSILIRNIIPPQEIASIIRERQIAFQNRKKYEQQIQEAKSKAELVKQEQLAIQNKEKTEQETVKIKQIINARQNQAVALTSANKNLDVAKLENEAADFQVGAIFAKGQANRDVVSLKMNAEAKAYEQKCKAFNGGLNLAKFEFYKVACSNMQSLFTTDDGAIGNIFSELTGVKEGGVK